MSVIGMAEKKPAREIWAIVNGGGCGVVMVVVVVCGEKVRTRDLPTS